MGVINTDGLDEQKVEEHVRRIVDGANTCSEVAARLRIQLSPSPHVSVQEANEHFWCVLIQIRRGEPNRTIYCRR
jgi:hypothetical protein